MHRSLFATTTTQEVQDVVKVGEPVTAVLRTALVTQQPRLARLSVHCLDARVGEERRATASPE